MLAVWLLFAAAACAIFVTYARLPARELYHVTGSGLEGGASRVLVYVNFPIALAAIPVVALCFERLPGLVRRAAAIGSVLLCAAIFWPGIVDQADLDARPVNAICAAGVVLALAVTWAARGGGWRRSRSGDRLRLVLGAALVVLSMPWLAAELGFFLNGVPLLGRLFLTGEYRREQPGLPAFAPAVHHGDHHGLNGALLVASALLLSRLLPSIGRTGLRVATAAYLALLFAYGAGNIANDFWLEQVAKRDWTRWLVPSVLEPHVGWGWAVVLVEAFAVWALWFNRLRA